MELEDDDQPKRFSTAKKVRIGLALTVALASVGFYGYTRYGVVKSGLGGPCTYAYHCGKDAPRCMRASEDEAGICSRPCDLPADCAPDVHCLKVELDERDERGVPLEGGYCFPQSFLDARKKKKPGRADAGAGAPKDDAWLAAPDVAGQLEGELSLRTDRGSQQGVPRSYVVKGSVVRDAPGSGKRRALVDTAGLRAFSVDDDKRTFTATVLSAPPGDVKVDKTGKKGAVLGRDCDVWRLDDGRSVREACILQGAAFIDLDARSVAPWQRELAVRGALPVEIVERDKSGAELSHTVATRLDLHPVDAALFTIPKAYKNLAAR